MMIVKEPEKEQWASLFQRPQVDTTHLEEIVSIVFKEINSNGDAAVKKYTARYDGVDIEELLVDSKLVLEASEKLDDKLKQAMQVAYDNIKKFHESQKEEMQVITTSPGVECWRKSFPIERVGLYIPGGTAPLFSTVLMLAIPASIAGCNELILCTPPDEKGDVHPAILYAAHLAGVTKIFKVGGIQAIAALSMGTETIPQANKIFGPGNQYVTAAKQYANSMGTAIDMPAGPSEVLVLADGIADPEFVAADLLAQAEHGTDSQVMLISMSEELIDEVKFEIQKQLEGLPRKDIAEKALEYCKLIYVSSKEKAIEMTNEYAPEHLILCVEDEGYFLNHIQNAGSVFIGNYTPESAGDYASGTNHTLPTNGFAKAYSGVSLDSFVKKITFQRISSQGIQYLGPAIETMAEAEKLEAHKNAVSVRLRKLKGND